MESSNQLRQIREEKLQKIQALVGDVYPRKAHPTDTVHSFIGRFVDRTNEEIEQDTNTYSLMGRIIAFRDQGKTVFLHLLDQGAKVQIYLRKDGLTERDWEILHLCDLGDFIETHGTLMRTKTGELTLRCSSLIFLTKALLPLPEKWHGLQDIEIRYRQRYLDLISDPEVFSIFQKRSEIITSIRSFMKTQGYLEVETPMMHSIPGGATAKPFTTHHNALDIPLYLRIAPELFLKQLIIGGFSKIYEINRNFRNEGLSSKHNPEFTMMESYAAGEDLRDMMILVEGVIRHAASIIHKDLTLPWGSQIVDYGKPFQRISLRNSLTAFGDFDEKQIDNIDYLRSEALKYPIEDRDNKSVGLLQFELFEHAVESKLIQPVFITDYPVEVSPLTKLVDGSLEIVDRFELFIGGMEIANAYSELNDPIEQLKRLESQSRERDSGNEEAMHIDEAFVEAMEHGMPPTGGQGLGIDRLVMLLTNQNSIRDVILFPLMRPSKTNPS